MTAQIPESTQDRMQGIFDFLDLTRQNVYNQVIQTSAKQDIKDRREQIKQAQQTQFFRDFYYLIRNIPFWIIDKKEHKARYEGSLDIYGVPCCCFNHFVGLPRKLDDDGINQFHPLYEYETILYDNLINRGIKWQWVKKATGLGITEYYLRLIVWLCIYEPYKEKFQGSQICIVVGPNLDLGKKLMKRVKYCFNNIRETQNIPSLKSFVLEGSAKEIIINNVTITVFPSNHLDAMRGQPNVSFVLIDEGDYFPPSEQLNVLTVSTRYIAKSAVWIAMVSTPGLPNGLFETIEKDKNSPFDKQYFDYHWGMKEHGSNMFTPQMISDARKHRLSDFAREYENKYAGFSGNIFTVEYLYGLQRRSSYRIVSLLDEPEQESYIYEDEFVKVKNVNVKAFDEFVNADENQMQYYYFAGVDPGYASSKFGITIMRLNLATNKIEVIYEAEFSSANSFEMVSFIAYLVRTLHIKKVAVDRSDVDFIRNLKEELQDYEDVDFTKLSKDELKYYINGDMIVIPVTFTSESKRNMLYHLRDMMYGDFIRISERCKMLYAALSSIKVTESMTFKKADVPHNDTLDSFMAALTLVNF